MAFKMNFKYGFKPLRLGRDLEICKGCEMAKLLKHPAAKSCGACFGGSQSG